jgi:hypothetical protein
MLCFFELSMEPNSKKKASEVLPVVSNQPQEKAALNETLCRKTARRRGGCRRKNGASRNRNENLKIKTSGMAQGEMCKYKRTTKVITPCRKLALFV